MVNFTKVKKNVLDILQYKQYRNNVGTNNKIYFIHENRIQTCWQPFNVLKIV